MIELISPADFSKASGISSLKADFLALPLMKLFGISRINKLYASGQPLEGISFVDAVLTELDIRVSFNEEGLKNIPATGGFIVMANHPFGGLDGLILLKLFAGIRPDFKILSNFLLQKVENISSYFIPVSPFDTRELQHHNTSGLKRAIRHLDQESALGIFPAGEVSSFHLKQGKVIDRNWSEVITRLALKANIPIVPVYFKGRNSVLFNSLGLVHPLLRTARLPSELVSKKGHCIEVTIGEPYKPRAEGFTIRELTGQMKEKVYSLKHYVKPQFTAPQIISETEASWLEKEIQDLPASNHLFSEMEFDVYVSESAFIPNVLREIGRLREITFRAIGEGSNQSLDFDVYDNYYHHLFIWDRKERKIVGSYRAGICSEILGKRGKEGLYLNTLFEISEELIPLLRQSVELGRSFVRREYQLKHMPLLILWRGIIAFLGRQEGNRYLLGAVSISNSFSKSSKTLMVEFIKRNYFDQDLASLVNPRQAFEPDMIMAKSGLLASLLDGTIKSIDEIIGRIEPEHKRMPVLLKKYIKQKGKVIGFNVDPRFNNALDCLLVMDTRTLPDETFKLLKR